MRRKSWDTSIDGRKDPLFAVPPEQQSKCQDLESTVTNWEESD
jgi:hypothetical protein